ncbi:MAG: glycoside hydrolase family 2 protein [Christensenellales bacterium]
MDKNIPVFALSMHDTTYDQAYKIDTVSPDSLFDPFDRRAESLDGNWKFTIDPYETGMRKKWFQQKNRDGEGNPIPVDFDFENWGDIKVPSCFNTQRKEYAYYEGMVWYTRTFRYAETSQQERVHIMFEGANHECRVWLNGHYILRHLGGSTPFCADITKWLEPENRLLVMVNNQRRAEHVPALNTDWFNYGGLYRSVLLYRMPHTFIRNAFIRLLPDGTLGKIAVHIQVEGDAQSCMLEIPDLGINEEIPLHENIGEIVISTQAVLWTPDSPTLYQVILTCGQDRVQDDIGFKELKANGRQLILNGSPIFLRGISFHEDHPETGKSLDKEKVECYFSFAKELNCNFIRLAHYPHSRFAAKLADRWGFLLWEEIPVYWAVEYNNENTIKSAGNQLKELILRDRNRVSVGIWSIGNETPDSDDRLAFMTSLINICRACDDIHLVSSACLVNYEQLMIQDRLAKLIDVIGINEYFGWYRGNMQQLRTELDNMSLKKPLIITEFGAGALAGYHGTINDLFTEECQADFYEKQLSTLQSRFDIISGIIPWILFDFRSPGRTNSFQRGYNRKGLLSSNCDKKKIAFDVLKRFYSNLKDSLIET